MTMKSNQRTDRNFQSRRNWLTGSLLGGAGLVSYFAGHSSANAATCDETDAPDPDYKIVNGRAKQSVMAWCFNPMPMEELILACAKMGLSAMEGIDMKYYPLMKQHGLGVSLCGSHGFKKGPISKDNHEFCAEKLRRYRPRR